MGRVRFSQASLGFRFIATAFIVLLVSGFNTSRSLNGANPAVAASSPTILVMSPGNRNADGFRFAVSFTASSSVDMQGLVLVGIVDGRLNAIFYAAPKVHYYEAYLDEVEAIMSSVVVR